MKKIKLLKQLRFEWDDCERKCFIHLLFKFGAGNRKLHLIRKTIKNRLQSHSHPSQYREGGEERYEVDEQGGKKKMIWYRALSSK